jgi:hypothetical protein
MHVLIALVTPILCLGFRSIFSPRSVEAQPTSNTATNPSNINKEWRESLDQDEKEAVDCIIRKSNRHPAPGCKEFTPSTWLGSEIQNPHERLSLVCFKVSEILRAAEKAWFKQMLHGYAFSATAGPN